MEAMSKMIKCEKCQTDICECNDDTICEKCFREEHKDDQEMIREALEDESRCHHEDCIFATKEKKT